MDLPNPNEIFARIKSAMDDNKKLHALSVELSEKIRILSKLGNDAGNGALDDTEFKRALSVLDDPIRARAWLLIQLKQGMENAPNAQIAKELRDMLGIASNTDNLEIATIDYKNALLNCPKCGFDLAKQDNTATNPPEISDDQGPDSHKPH
jgi:hypothetical protein